jgi:hypothetical protein
MAISLVNTASMDAGGTSAKITHGLTITAGNLLVAFVHSNSNGSLTITDNNPGFPFTTASVGSYNGNSGAYGIFTRVATASEPADYRWTSYDRHNITLFEFSGVDVSIWDVSPGTISEGNGSTATASSITTLTNNAFALLFCGWDTNAGSMAGATNGFALSSAIANRQPTGIGTKPISVAGAVGNSAVVATSVGSNSHFAVQMALKEFNPLTRAILNIDTDDIVFAGQSSVTINTAGLDSSPSTQTATLGGESLSVTSWSASSVVVDIPETINLKWGDSYTLELTDDTGSVTLADVQLLGRVGWSTVVYNGVVPPTSTESFVEKSGFSAAAGDTLAWSDYSGLTIDEQTIPTVDPPATATGTFMWWDESADSWDTEANYTITDLGEAPPSVGGQTLQQWVDTLPYEGSTTEKLMQYMRSQGHSGGMTEMMYEHLKTVSSKNSHSERYVEWKNRGFN